MFRREKKKKITQSSKKNFRYISLNPSTTLIASIFILSFAARLSAGIDGNKASSIAKELFQKEESFSETSEKVSSLLEAIEIRARSLDDRESELAVLEEGITRRKAEMTAQIKQMEAAEERLRSLIGSAQNAALSDVDKIISLYEMMKPKEAAAVFEMMEPALAAGFLSEMKPNNASGVLAKLSPAKSYAISVYLAGRNVE